MSWIGHGELIEKAEILPQEVKEALDQAAELVTGNLPGFRGGFPKAYSENGFYEAG